MSFRSSLSYFGARPLPDVAARDHVYNAYHESAVLSFGRPDPITNARVVLQRARVNRIVGLFWAQLRGLRVGPAFILLLRAYNVLTPPQPRLGIGEPGFDHLAARLAVSSASRVRLSTQLEPAAAESWLLPCKAPAGEPC